jgi:poly-gamma-glutamate capsule biosynthesis protein CapA/YwtB (metallophosphatase superfamily)
VTAGRDAGQAPGGGASGDVQPRADQPRADQPRADPPRAGRPGRARHAPPPGRGRRVAAALTGAWVIASVATLAVFASRGDLAARVGQAAAAPPRAPAAAAHSSAPAKAVTAAPALATVSITGVGDMNFGMNGVYPPGGAAAMLAGVSGDLHSDLTVGNMETALGSSGTTKCGKGSTNCYAFQAPASEALGVAQSGFSAVNVANNHTDDAGPAGMAETDTALSAARLLWTGRPGQITYLTRNGVRIALLGFAPYDYDSNLLDIPAAQAQVRQAAAHAQLVIVFMHAGAEGVTAQHVRPGMETYDGELRGNPIAFSHAVIDAGADLVLGSGPHVLRAMQWYHGKLIAYSLGNFAGYYTLGLTGVTADSAILHVVLRANGTFASGSVTPIRLAGAGLPEPDPARTGIQLINSLSRADLGPSGVHINPGGVIVPPAPASPAPLPAALPTPLSTSSPLTRP